MMDGPHGLQKIDLRSAEKLPKPQLPLIAVVGFGNIYIVDQLNAINTRQIYAIAGCMCTPEKELTAAKQWLLDIAYLKYA